ncbi:MAG TPA: hypothetical protein VGR35_07340 [Tepidisphaeraceae bacterium]|nr:hypothetical protein [Tepidisphaeraceae bacterium]
MFRATRCLIVLAITMSLTAAQPAAAQQPPSSAPTSAAGVPDMGAFGDRSLGIGEGTMQDLSSPDNPMLPDVKFDSVSVEEVVEFLRQATPRFQAVLVREDPSGTGYPDTEFPKVRLRLKNVPVSQVLGVLEAAYPQITVTAVAPPPNSHANYVHVIRVGSSPGRTEEAAREAASTFSLSVYRVGPALDPRQIGPGHPEAVAAQRWFTGVVSLLKEAMGRVPNQGAITPELFVHEPTGSVIVRATRAQHRAAADALAALASDTGTSEVSRLRQSLAEAQQRIEKIEALMAPRNAGVPSTAAPAASPYPSPYQVVPAPPASAAP